MCLHACALYLYFTYTAQEAPTLTFFALNLQQVPGVIGLQFNIPVDITTCAIAAVTLHSSSDGSGSEYALTSGTCADLDGQVSITLSSADRQAIDGDTALATSIDTTYISLGQFIQSSQGVPNQIIDTPVQASFYLGGGAPSGISVDFAVLDLDAGFLTLGFNTEIATINPNGITIGNIETNSTIMLTGDFVQLEQPTSSYNLTFTEDTFNFLRMGFGSSVNFSAWRVLIESNTIATMDGTQNTLIFAPLSGFQPDSTPPSIEYGNLDMDAGSVVIGFSEPIDIMAANLDAAFIVNRVSPPFMTNYSLSNSVVNSSATTELTINLPHNTVIQLKANAFIATSTDNTYFFLRQESFSDFSANTLPLMPRAILTDFVTEDTTRPNFLSFSISLDLGTLDLTFDKPLDETSFDVSGITFVSGSSSLLAEGEVPSLNFSSFQTVVNIVLSTIQVNGIKLLLYNAGSNQISIAMTNSTCHDTSGNLVASIPVSSAIQATTIILDQQHPFLVSFSPNRRPPDNFSMRFTFNEYMDPNSFDPSSLMLTLTSSVYGTNVFTSFSGGTLTNIDYSTFDYSFNVSRLSTNFPIAYQIAYYSGNMSVTFGGEFLSDLAGRIVSTPNPPAVFVSNESDPISPALQSFSLDLSQAVLQLTFSEAVVVQQVSGSSLILQDTITGSNTYSFSSATYAGLQGQTGLVLTINIDSSDIQALLANDLIATGIDNTFLSISQSFATDYSGNMINNTAPIQASSVIGFVSIAPSATTSAIASTTSILMTTTMITSSSVAVTSSSAQETSSQVISSSEASSTPQISSEIPSTTEDLSTTALPSPTMTTTSAVMTTTEMVTTSDAATTSIAVTSTTMAASSTRVAVTSTTMAASSTTMAVSSTTMAVSSTTEVISSIAPSPTVTISTAISSTPQPSGTPIAVTEATLDMNSGFMNITTSRDVQLINVADNFMLSNGSVSVTLTDASTFLIVANTDFIITMGTTDLNSLKILQPSANWSLTVQSGAIFDNNVGSNSLQTIPFSFFVPDTTPPNLFGFSLNMNSKTLTLSFNEPIIANNATSGLFLSNASSVNIPPNAYQLNTVIESNSTDSITLAMMTLTVTILKFDATIATSTENLFIFLTQGSFEDYSSNPIQTSSIQATAYTFDFTQPSLVSYQIDLNSGSMTLAFSEPVNPGTINSNGFFISGSSPISSSANIVASFIGASEYNTRISLNIISNINEIKLALYGSPDAYISVPSSFITDTADNSLDSVLNSSPLQASQVHSDTISPSVTGFTPNASAPNTGSISFSFDEYIDLSSLSESSFTITLNNSLINATYQGLNGGVWSSAPNNATATYSFSQADRQQNFFGISYLLAVNSGQVSATFSTSLATDLAGNILNAQASPLIYTGVLQDNVRPQFQSFSIDLDSGDLTLSFSEDVILLAIPGNIRFQDAPSNPLTVFTLSSDAYNNQTGLYGSTVSIRLSMFDAGTLFNDTRVANTVNDTFLSLGETLAVDYSGNALSASGVIQASQVITSLTPVNPPLLQNATLDLNNNSLILTFNQAMSPSLTVPGLISLTPLGISLSPSTNVGLFNDNDTILQLSLTQSDSSDIKFFFTTDIFVSLGSNAAFSTESEGNLIQSLQIQTIVPDTTGPSVSSYTFDLNSGQVIITFNEPVSNETYNASSVWLSNAMNSLPSGQPLTSSDVIASSASNTIMIIQLPSSIITTVTSDPNLATSSDNTFLFFTPSSFQDLFFNPLQPPPSSIKPTSFVSDSTSPSLQAFTLDLDNGVLSLSFSEVVIASSFQVSQLTLYDTSLSNNLVVTDSTTLSTGYVSIINAQIQGSSLNMLKALLNGGLVVRLSMTSSAITDSSSNEVTAISSSNPLNSAQVTPDTTAPSLLSLTAGNVAEKTLTMTFNEYIEPASWNDAGLTLYLNTSTGIYTFTGFTNGQVSSDISSNLTYVISDAKFQGLLQIRYQQAYYSGSIGVSLSPTTVTDIGGNEVIQSTVYYFSMMTDPGSPQLVSFQLDLDNANLTMIFSEPVLINQIQNQVIVQNSASSPTESVTLTSNAYDSQEGMTGTSITLTLQLGDVISIAGNPDLGSTTSNTYLSLGTSMSVDYSGNFLQSQSSAIQASSVVDYSGQLNPQVRSFDLDLDSNQMTLHFSAPVNVSTLIPSKITLLNATSLPLTTVSLTNVTLIAQGEQTDFRFLLNTRDIINIKRHPLCYTESNCYGSFAQGLALNSIQLQSLATPSVQVSSLVQDVTPPRFLAFPVFDLNSGLFTIIFSEPINGSSTQFTQVTFSNEVSSPSQSVTLTEGFTSPDSIEIDFHLTRDDLNSLKYRLNLCTNRSNCWVKLPSFFVADIGSNPFLHSNYQPGASASYHQPTVFIPDTTSPILERYSIDMNTGELVLSFDEVVDESFFQANDVTLLNATSSQLRLTLNNLTQYVRLDEGTSIQLTLTTEDLNWIKARDFYSSISNSYLSLVTLMTDVSGNVLFDITPSFAIQAYSFTRDRTLVNLIRFDSFNLDNGSFFLSFDEPVQVESLNTTALVFASGSSGSPVTYRLTGGNATQLNDEKLTIRFDLSKSDRVAIKLMTGLATNEDNTYIYTDASLAMDASGNSNAQISIASAIRVTSGGFTSDTSLAEISSSELDMDAGLLKLVFTDVIRADSVMPFLISIQSHPSVSDGTKHTLSTSSTSSSQSSDEITIYLPRADVDSIKANLDLASQSNNSYVSFPTTMAEDVEGRNVIGVPNTGAHRVTVYVPDTTSPQLESYSIDLDAGTMTLSLSEPVLLQSYTPEELTIQNTAGSPSSSFTLTSGRVTATNSIADSAITLVMDYNDLNEIKNRTSLASSSSDTFLMVGSGFFTDTSKNSIISVSALSPSSYSGDVTLPVLVTFSLDLRSSGQLALNFSEAVRYTPSLQSTIMLQNRATNPTVVLSLTSNEAATRTKLDEVTITLSSTHTNRLLTDSDIAENTDSLYISMTPGGIYDYSNGQGQTIASLTQKASYLCKSLIHIHTAFSISL